MKPILPPSKPTWTRWHHKFHHLLRDDPLLIPQGSSLLVAVSGGQDSLALTRLLLDLQPQHQWKLELWHGNHNWREDSEDNCEHIVRLAKDWGLELTIDQAKPAPKGEIAARDWRFKCLIRLAERKNIKYILTGHTSSDKAETVLHHIVRGSDLNGVSSPRQKRNLTEEITLLHPLLSFDREDTKMFCKELNLPIWVDRTNSDKRITRNFIRIEIMPKLKQINPKAELHIARFGYLAEELEAKQTQLEQLAIESLMESKNQLELNRLKWQAISNFIQNRLIHHWIEKQCGYCLSSSATEEICKQIRQCSSSKVIYVSQNWHIKIQKQKVILQKTK